MSIIRFDQVDLEYPIRENQVTFKEYILSGVFRRRLLQKRKTVRALQDLTFRIDDGDRVGIIGNNGAGKSTLLRTIAGIYPICKGERAVTGRVCSLFDIAIGFEPDESGWNNIYYRSYLQGDTPKMVESKIKEIADFTELGEFLDLPLRCYSTGMAMRLAFAVATSSHPEILLIDEIFGTGDISFQKKAEQRMKDFIRKAKVVIMVGHSLDYFRSHCQRVLWLDHGKIRADGEANDVIDRYCREVERPAELPKAA